MYTGRPTSCCTPLLLLLLLLVHVLLLLLLLLMELFLQCERSYSRRVRWWRDAEIVGASSVAASPYSNTNIICEMTWCGTSVPVREMVSSDARPRARPRLRSRA